MDLSNVNNMSTAEAAGWYADNGLPVVPLRPRDKRPVNGGRFLDQAIRDAETARKVWGEHPEYNIGVPLGEGLAMIDLDRHEGGTDGVKWVREWERENGKLPISARVISGSENPGVHLYYRFEEDLTNATNGDIGVDIRGNGGFAVVPPSVHPSGRRYIWADNSGIASANETVMALIDAITGKKDGHRESLKVGGEVSKGGRNDTLFKLASSLIAKELPAEAIRASVHATNTATCNPPLQASEVDALLDSALSRYEPGMSDEAKEAAESTKGDAPVHLRIARRLIKDGLYKIDGSFAFWHPDKKRWLVGDSKVKSRMLEINPGVKSTNRKEVIEYLNLQAPEGNWAEPRFIAFNNGVLDLDTMELAPMDHTKVFPNIIPHDWNPEACAPIVDETLNRIACNDPDVAFALAEVIGLAMYRGHDIAQIPLLYGDGANGKSTLMNFIYGLVGNNNCTTIDLQQLTHVFTLNKLNGALCCISDDVSAEYITANMASNLKKMATGDFINAEEKYGRSYQFRPYCGLVITANRVPRVIDSSSWSIQRRLLPIPLNARFSRSDPDFNPNLEAELSTEDAYERGIVIGVTALCLARQNKGLYDFEKSNEALRQIVLEADTVGQWMEDAVPEIAEKLCKDVYADYRDWCRENGVTPLCSNRFGREIKNRWAYISAPKWNPATQKNERYYALDPRVFEVQQVAV